ncbi:MAG: signal peptidase I [Propionibacteriaceae bacterium]|nr:signal peptidase I [Propionibacteriaceae bacterium]
MSTTNVKPTNVSPANVSMAKPPSAWRDLGHLALKILVIGLALVALFTLVFGLVRYREPGMSPAVKDSDLVVFFRHTKAYHPSDLVVLDYEGTRQVRRVIATAGDTVDITDAGLTINGALQQEPGIHEATKRYADGVDFPLTIAEGEVFVLADARENGTDSRVYGAIKTTDIRGKVTLIIKRQCF